MKHQRIAQPESRLPRLLAYIIGGVICLLPFHALLTTWAGSAFGYLDAWRIWKELIIFAIFLPALYLSWSRPILWGWLKHDWLPRLILVYVALHLLLGVWTYQQDKVNVAALIYALLANLRFLGFFVICFMVASFVPSLKKYWWHILLIPAGIVIVFGIMQLFLPADFLRHFGYGPATIPVVHTVDDKQAFQRIQSTMRGPNPLGAYLVLIIPAAIVALQGIWRKVAVGGLAAIVLLYSYSRSAWLGTMAALATLFGLTYAGFIKRHYKTCITGLVTVSLLMGLSLFVLRDVNWFQNAIFHSDETSQSKISSNTGRARALQDGLDDVLTEPLGRGPGTAGPASTRNDAPARLAENYYLQIGQEVGWLGLGLFLAINVLILRFLWSIRTERQVRVLLVSFVGLIVVNLVSHAWADDTLGLLWWGLAGITLAPAILKTNKRNHVASTKKAKA